MSQLAEIENIVATHTSSDEAAGALLFEILQALRWDIEGVGNPADATAYLNKEE
jgi:beta-lactamase superfamily II metal-dependent hydrolase